MLELDKDNFTKEIKDYTEKPVLVDFWSDSCKTCKELMPSINNLAKKYGDKIKFASLNIKGARRLAISQRVMGLPALIMYESGEIIDRMSPDDINEDIDNIENFIKKYIKNYKKRRI